MSIFSGLFATKKTKVVMTGLETAGKTTALYQLKLDGLVQAIPTMPGRFNLEQLRFLNLDMEVWDVTMNHYLRNLWGHYLQNSNGLIYVVDSSQRDWISVAKEELWFILEQEETANLPLLVLANKQDLSRAANPTEVTDLLELFKLRRRWYVQETCAKSGKGLVEGLTWLAEEIKKRQKTN